MKSSGQYPSVSPSTGLPRQFNPTNNGVPGVNQSWDDLRRQARILENEIDLKLVSFSKMGASFSKPAPSARDLANISTPPGRYQTLANELEQLLERLTQVNDGLSECLHHQSTVALPSGGSGLLHTLQRHRDILQDYQQEFLKTKSNIAAVKEREELLGSVREDIAEYKTSSGLNPRTSLLLQEHEHARHAERLIDQQLSVANSIKENLRSQDMSLRGAQQRLMATLSHFPSINNLIHRINFRRRRDTLVLAGVTSLCLLFIIWYLFH